MLLRLFAYLSLLTGALASGSLGADSFESDSSETLPQRANRAPAVLPLPTDHPTDFGNSDLTLMREDDWVEGTPSEIEL
jgi:hypothetical protein